MPSVCLSGLTTGSTEVNEKKSLGPLCRDSKLLISPKCQSERDVDKGKKNGVKVHLYKKGRLDFYGNLSGFLFFDL